MKKILVALCLSAFVGTVGPALGADKVSVAVSWVITGADAPYFVAKEKGFYNTEGLDVTITRGYGTLENAKRLNADQINFADADTPALILARDKGANVKLIAMYYHKNPQAVVFRKDTGIKTLKDLEGKKVGGFVGGANTVLFPALAKANNIDPEKVKFITLAPSNLAAALASKTVDATLEYVVAFPDNEKAVSQAGGEAAYFLFADYGVSLYGQGIAASDKMIKEKPDVVQRFLRASFRGRAWCLENPEGAIDIIMKQNPQFTSRPEVAATFRIASSLLFDGLSDKNGTGYMAPEKIKTTMQVIAAAYGIKPLALDSVYTNDFLKEIPKEWNFPKKLAP